jgi:ssDNA-binding replication factor A large subunit
MPESKPPATFIADLRPNRVATFEATVARVEPVRELETERGTPRKVQSVRLQDRTGEILLTLWGPEVDQVHEGDRIRITEGWVKDYKGRPQVSLGRTGTLTQLPRESP